MPSHPVQCKCRGREENAFPVCHISTLNISFLACWFAKGTPRHPWRFERAIRYAVLHTAELHEIRRTPGKSVRDYCEYVSTRIFLSRFPFALLGLPLPLCCQPASQPTSNYTRTCKLDENVHMENAGDDADGSAAEKQNSRDTHTRNRANKLNVLPARICVRIVREGREKITCADWAWLGLREQNLDFQTRTIRILKILKLILW